METKTLIYKDKEYVPINMAAKLINVNVGMIYYYINRKKIRILKIENLKLIEMDSLLVLNDYIQFRSSKNNHKINEV